MEPLSFASTKQYHRVPVAFGPAASPRQDPNGNRFDWSKAVCKTVGITYKSTHEALNAILPEGYSVDANKDAIVMFEVMELRNLPWLNGRGYNTWACYVANVICTRTKNAPVGSYLAVLFESFTDPITTGREELGFPKVWAELPDGWYTSEHDLIHTASWFGKEFMRLRIPALEKRDPSEAPCLKDRAWTHPTKEGFLHHRYVPAVGKPGEHDASYTIWAPGPPGKPPVIAYETIPAERFSEIEFDIADGKWEELPTLWNIVAGLKDVPRLDIVEVAVQTFQGASDLKTCHRLE